MWRVIASSSQSGGADSINSGPQQQHDYLLYARRKSIWGSSLSIRQTTHTTTLYSTVLNAWINYLLNCVFVFCLHFSISLKQCRIKIKTCNIIISSCRRSSSTSWANWPCFFCILKQTKIFLDTPFCILHYGLTWIMQRTLHTFTYQFNFFVVWIIFTNSLSIVSLSIVAKWN